MTDIDKLERLLAEATPGPWEKDEWTMQITSGRGANWLLVATVANNTYRDRDRHTRDLIIALRNAAAELIANARRYREVRRGHRWSVKTCIGDALRAETLDAAVDAIAQERKA